MTAFRARAAVDLDDVPSAIALMIAGHVLMLPAMLIAMLHRRHEYGW